VIKPALGSAALWPPRTFVSACVVTGMILRGLIGFDSRRVRLIAASYRVVADRSSGNRQRPWRTILEGTLLTDEIYRVGGLPVRRAVRKAAQKWKFPARPKGQIAIVSYPFVLN
jgi:hypothetical protein